MKINIEIDGAGAAASAQPAAATGPADQSTAPPDVLARAEAIGAIDGGAAPSEQPVAGAPPVPAALHGTSSSVPAPALPDEAGALSAGPAPGAPPAPSVTVEQDPDAPTTPDSAE